MNSSFYSGRFDSIQAMRGLAALSVVFDHIIFIKNGAFGVDIFFCISGFIMMYVTHISTEHFLLKRAVRIIPLYYFMTFVTFAGLLMAPGLFDKTVADAGYLVKSLLFVPPVCGGPAQPVVKVGWTLNYEVFFYIIIWAALLISKKYRGLIASGIICVVVGIGYLSGNDCTIMFEFIYGILAYEVLKRIDYSKKASGETAIRMYKDISLVLIALCCYIFMWFVEYIPALNDINRIVSYGIPAFILFVCLFAGLYEKKLPSAFVFVGNISYSVYLLHYFVARLFNKFGDSIPKIAIVLLVMAISIGLGTISYYIFEKKVSKYLRIKLNI